MEVSPTLLHLLIARLERISVDSRLAHRASGLRGSLLNLLERIELGGRATETDRELTRMGFELLRLAAREKVRH